MSRFTDTMVFDADNHLYETRDAFTRFLPDRYKGVIDYVDVRGRTKIVVKGRISEFIPNPTFEVVARPGAQEDYFRHGNPEGKGRREREFVPLPTPVVQAIQRYLVAGGRSISAAGGQRRYDTARGTTAGPLFQSRGQVTQARTALKFSFVRRTR